MVAPKLNVVFTGFPYPQGLAGTKRNQHAIDALKKYDASVKVLVLRQSTKINTPNGVYGGVPYETIGSVANAFSPEFACLFLKKYQSNTDGILS